MSVFVEKSFDIREIVVEVGDGLKKPFPDTKVNILSIVKSKGN